MRDVWKGPQGRVVAVRRITEEDAQPNRQAEPCEPGWVHAEPGDEGVVMHTSAQGAQTVRFIRSGTAITCYPDEIVPTLNAPLVEA